MEISMKEYYQKNSDELFEEFHVTSKGLSESQVKEIRERVGENVLEEEKRKSIGLP